MSVGVLVPLAVLVAMALVLLVDSCCCSCHQQVAARFCCRCCAATAEVLLSCEYVLMYVCGMCYLPLAALNRLSLCCTNSHSNYIFMLF